MTTTDTSTTVQPPCSPAEMPDVRLALIESWQRPAWRQSARAGIARARAIGTTRLASDRSLTSATDSYCRYEQNTLRDAEMWWVGPEMCDLLYATAAKVPLDTTLEHLNLPSTQALVVFAKPWLATDADLGARSLIVDAITWGPAKLVDDTGERFALGVSAYRLLDFAAGLSSHELQLATFVGAVDQAQRTLISKSGVGAEQRVELNLTGRVWAPLGRSDWPLQATVGDTETGYDPLNDSVEAQKIDAYSQSAVEDRQLVAALSLLLNTRTMTQLTDAALPRPVRRRSQRAGVAASVNVVYLRRPEHERSDAEHDPDKPAVEWSHRWIVSAHPRLQPYGPGRSMRKLIMVPPHVKGPDDKPLVVKPTVKAWVR